MLTSQLKFALAVAFPVAVFSLGAAETKKPLDFAKLPPAATGPVDFVKDIQPLLAGNCFKCHGAEKQKGGLRLDLKQAALIGGDSGAVIVPGKATESKLIQLIAKLDGETQMPPSGEGRKPLTREQIAKLRAWIEAGANWPDSAGTQKKSEHWAFNAPKRPAVPQVQISKFKVQNPIDAFILARLEKEKIKPSPEADRYTLIRRLSLDLLGLPPKPEEVHQFLSDNSPDAYGRLVDRLLASPHFGERWGRHWLDLARYADSDGYEKDRPRPFAYVYRDWVIKAINDDLPFNRFSIMQLAGDLLPNAGLAEQTATGFHRQTLTNTEGGTDQEEFRCKATVDRVSTTAAVWLGVTMNCCECHSHKYDPFTQREFYQLFAFFNNASEKNVPAPQANDLTAVKKWEDEKKRLQRALDTYEDGEFPRRRDQWAKSAATNAVPWRTLVPDKFTAKNGTTFTVRKADGAIVAGGASPARDTYTIEAPLTLKQFTGIRLETLTSADTDAPGRSKDKNFVLSAIRVAVRLPDADGPVEIPLGKAGADFSQAKFPVASLVSAKGGPGWAIAPQQDLPHVAVFAAKSPVNLPAGARLVVTLDHQYKEGFTLGLFRLSVTDSREALTPDSMTEVVALALGTSPEKRTKEQNESITSYYRSSVDTEAKRLRTALLDHRKKEPAVTTAAILTEEPAGRVTKVHIRGNFLDRGAEVRPLTPAVLHAFKPRAAKPDRLDLANWLFSPENPLTSRVTVNHVWKNLFGRGLVASVDDFGVKGEKPTHPELLDWLAVTFASPATINSPDHQPGLAWSRKALIKLIVTSAAYKQSSNIRADLVERDPNNLLLARQNRIRLEAESVRDAYLAASGLLNEKIGGPSIRPPLPADIAALGYANSVKWTESAGPEKNRRGLYIFFQRTVPYPMLMTFDAPDSNATCTRRERSNTPLQALTLLNDPVFFECAQALGQRMAESTGGDAAEKIRIGFERCFARPPTGEELTQLRRLYDAQLKLTSSDADTAAKISGAKKDDPTAAEKAALVALGRVMLNLDEFVTRD